MLVFDCCCRSLVSDFVKLLVMGTIRILGVLKR